jgi:Fe-Mn family superoxide dismutase
MTTLGETLFPLFCISVHECAWITAGYGIWGKEEWLRHFWTVLDWHKVSQAYMKWVPDTTAYI